MVYDSLAFVQTNEKQKNRILWKNNSKLQQTKKKNEHVIPLQLFGSKNIIVHMKCTCLCKIANWMPHMSDKIDT